MAKKRRILVTGVARWWGALVVQKLVEDPDVAEVIGIDIREPRYDLGRADYLKLDIRHSLIGKLVRAVGIDTVVHRSEEHTSELQSHSDLPSLPTRRSSDLAFSSRAWPAGGARLSCRSWSKTLTWPRSSASTFGSLVTTSGAPTT